jgi:ribosome modulation factor
MKATVKALLAAYDAGDRAKREGRSSNAPPRLTRAERRAWHNGWRDAPVLPNPQSLKGIRDSGLGIRKKPRSGPPSTQSPIPNPQSLPSP